ncbi:phenylacetate--CoA ligase family protein [Desulfofundulus sp.]|uniref:phenylacetate--CoA ligase family protein n=1 Tax=Desulfofundulus sp. TaxID=2282750 RepID=UPI003C7889FC
MADYYQKEVETMSRKELAELQFERLKWQVNRCYQNSPFYQEKWQKAGFEPRHLRTLADIRNIPVVTKNELRDEQTQYPPFGRFTMAPQSLWRELHPSSGTTGNPVNTIWAEQDVANITDVTARMMWGFGVRPGDIVQNGFSYGLWVAGMSSHYAAKKLGCFVIPIGAQMTSKQIQYFKNPGSHVLLSTPSFALHIAEKMAEEGLSPEQIPLRIGAFGGEGGTQNASTRSRLESGLGIDAYDFYGLAEIGPTFAAECTAKAGLHWAEDHYLIEIINPETMEPCAEGEIGVLVITHLTREATPMVRYWTNDLAKLITEPCACGRTHARSPGGILGRADDLVVYKGAKFYPSQVEKVIRSFDCLSDQYRIELTHDEERGVDICTVVVERTREILEEDFVPKLKKALKEELMVTPEVSIQPYGYIERTAFKAKRLYDLRKKV